VLLLGALSGGKSPLQPLAGLQQAKAPAQHVSSLPFQRVKTVQELDQRIAAAQGKPVMLDFYADWCAACKEMERDTFSDPRVQQRLRDFVLLQADVTANSSADAALLQRFRLFGPPGIIFFDRKGREMPNRIVGYQDAGQFLSSIQQLEL